jgi:hypothetical protein
MEVAAFEPQMAPDELAFREHAAAALFQQGVDRGYWRLLTVAWPHVVIAISAAPRPDSPEEFFFRFQLDGYPAVGTACPIDIKTNETLQEEKRPKGEIVGFAFRPDWENGEALYVPWDRRAINTHPEWSSKYAGRLWENERGIISYLRRTHDLLNSEDYQGV